VEINALWYNAVSIASELCHRLGHRERGEELTTLARTIKESFNCRFWHEQANCCFDVVEDHGNDPAIRPNQLLAISLPFAVLSLDRHARMLEKVRDELLTPLGLRTLSPHDPAYVGCGGGNVVERDRAQYNGSAHPWLLGPYITALFRVLGRGPAVRQTADELLQGPLEYLGGEGLGQICELFDGDVPHCRGGAPASAPAVGEILRCYAEDVLEMGPSALPPAPAASSDPQAQKPMCSEPFDADRIPNRGA
jgi:glycogen debranching enzyme